MCAASLLTDRQKLVLQYRRAGKTQQEIADILQTSRSNISTIEKAAHENIRMAKEALEYLYMLEATLVCTLDAGGDVTRDAFLIYDTAKQFEIKVQYTTGALINRITNAVPEKLNGTKIVADINVYLNKTGILYIC